MAEKKYKQLGNLTVAQLILSKKGSSEPDSPPQRIIVRELAVKTNKT